MEHREFPMEICRIQNNKPRLSISRPHGAVRLEIPEKMGERKALEYFPQRESWIEQWRKIILSENLGRLGKEGEKWNFLGQEYTLRLVAGHHHPFVVLKGDEMHLHQKNLLNPSKSRFHLYSWYGQRLTELLSTLIPVWEKKFDLPILKWSVGKLRSHRWTCINRHKSLLRFNSLLACRTMREIECQTAYKILKLNGTKPEQEPKDILNNTHPHWKNTVDCMAFHVEYPVACEDYPSL